LGQQHGAHQRDILEAAADHPQGIEIVALHLDPDAAELAKARFVADDAAKRRRPDHRAAGLAAERDRHHAGRDGRARSRRRTAREVGQVPRVPRGRPRQVERRTCMRHLVSGQLAQQHGAGLVELGRRGGVFRRNAVDEDPRVTGGEDPLRVVDVLEREGNSVERAPVPARRDLGLGLPCLAPRQIERAGDERLRLRVVCLDAPDQRIDQLHGRQLARRDHSRELGYRQVVNFCGHRP